MLETQEAHVTRSEKEMLWLLGAELTGECQGGNRESGKGLELWGICRSGKCPNSIHILKVELIGIIDEIGVAVRKNRNQQ